MRGRTGAVLALTSTAMLVVLNAVSASADAATIEPGVATYAVTVSDVSTGPSGEETVRADDGIVRLACAAEVCRVVAEPGYGFLGTVELAPAAAITGTAVSSAAGTPCAGGRGTRTIEIDARLGGFEATLEQQPVDWTDCPDGTEGFAHARTVTWTGTPLAVDPCIFQQGGCREEAAGASLLATGDVAAPSVLSALTPPTVLRPAPVQLMWAAVLTVVLVLLVAFPTALLNSAVEAGSERLSGWWSRRRRASVPPGTPTGEVPERRWSHSWWWAALGVLAAAVISAFVDPAFGFNPGSGRMVLSILASFAVDVVLGWLLVIWIMKRVQPGATHEYSFRPLTLLVVVAAVMFTRLTGFEPGIVFGLVAGVAFGALVGAAAEAKASLVTLGYAFGVAAVAWALYGAVAPSIGESAVATFAGEALASTAISGIAALPIALLPLGGLPGRAVWRWSRIVWAGSYAVGLFAFFVVLMPMPFSWEEVAWELWAWVGVYTVYAAAAVVAWLVLARPWRRADEAPADGRTEATPTEDATSSADSIGM
jgi:hypothetical protein